MWYVSTLISAHGGEKAVSRVAAGGKWAMRGVV